MEYLTTEDLDHLYRTRQKPMNEIQKDEIWKRAFLHYNMNHKQQLSMFCIGFYRTVFNYIKSKLEIQ